jgi:hypothetical protein
MVAAKRSRHPKVLVCVKKPDSSGSGLLAAVERTEPDKTDT